MFLKQSTAATIKLGPFVDSTDGVTAETGLTIAQADVRLSKNGGNMAQKNEATSASHDELGYYDVALDTTDTETLGRLKIMVAESGALPVWDEMIVVPANVYDSLVGGSDVLNTDVTQWLGQAVTAGVGNRPAVDAVGISGSTTAADNVEANIGNLDAAVSTRSTLTQAESNAACDSAIETYGLDHLVAASVTGTDVADDSIIAQMTSSAATADWDTFVNTTDSLQANRDKLTDVETDTDAMQQKLPTNNIMGSSDKTDKDDEIDSIKTSVETVTAKLPSKSYLAGTANADGDIQMDASTGSFNATQLAAINAEADTALADYDGPTNAELSARTLASASYATAATQTTILARLGDFAGTGLNSVKGFLQALFRSDAGVTGANVPSEINESENGTTGDYDGASDSIEGITDALAAVDANVDTIVGKLPTNNIMGSSDTDNHDTDIDAIKTKTDQLAFTSNRVHSDAKAIDASTDAAQLLADSAETIVPATVSDAAFSPTTTAFDLNLSEATDDHFIGRVIIFKTGTLADQATDITDYDGTNKRVTVTALTEAPANGDTLVIV